MGDAMTKQGQGCLGENMYRLGSWRKEPVHQKRRFCIIHMKVPWIQVSSPSEPLEQVCKFDLSGLLCFLFIDRCMCVLFLFAPFYILYDCVN